MFFQNGKLKDNSKCKTIPCARWIQLYCVKEILTKLNIAVKLMLIKKYTVTC